MPAHDDPPNLLSVTYVELDVPVRGGVLLTLPGGGRVTVECVRVDAGGGRLGIDVPRGVNVERAELVREWAIAEWNAAIGAARRRAEESLLSLQSKGV